MYFSYYYIFIYLVIGSGFLACKGQAKTEGKPVSIEKKRVLSKSDNQLDNQIWNIFQDATGRYWFGSKNDGLFSYDGKQLLQFTTNDGLVDNSIRAIKEDHLGNVYIDTPKGVSKFDGRSFVTLPIVTTQADDWKLNPHDLWFNSNANVNDVYRYDGQALHLLKLPRQDLAVAMGIDEDNYNSSDNPYAVYGLDKDKDGNLWIGTFVAGVFRYDGTSFLWIGEQELSVLEDGRAPAVRQIIQDKDDCFWLSNIRSKYKVKANNSYQKLIGIDLTQQNVDIELPYFMSAIQDSKTENLWMVTYDEGLWMYDGSNLSQSFIYDGNKKALLISIFQDKDGVLWLGTDNAGIFKYDGVQFEKFRVK